MYVTSHTPECEFLASHPHTLTGDFRIHKQFRSRFLQPARDVLVYLPPGYAQETERRYPVLYLHDGQNLFDGATSFIPGQEWCVDETAQALIRGGEVEPLIIVGVYNTGHTRVDEYTPTRDARFNAGGHADNYGRLLVEELKPFVDAHYRTKRAAVETGLGGSSLGGLVSLYLGLRYPQVFGKLAVISPSIWWDERVILREVAAVHLRPQTRIWLDMGTGESHHAMSDARLLRDALLDKGWSLGADLSYFEAAGAHHNELAWAARVGAVLRFLFPRR